MTDKIVIDGFVKLIKLVSSSCSENSSSRTDLTKDFLKNLADFLRPAVATLLYDCDPDREDDDGDGENAALPTLEPLNGLENRILPPTCLGQGAWV